MKPEFHYQRLIVGYHGCKRMTRDRVLQGNEKLKPSEKSHDWLGQGIYFWEHGISRAKEWAETRYGKGLKEPSVLGAVIQLGNCFDLLDTAYTQILTQAWPQFQQFITGEGQKFPQNKAAHGGDQDQAVRLLDCAMVNWTISQTEKAAETRYDTVRGVFQEGDPAFPGSHIFAKSHIQIAVRNPDCILGYFLPKIFNKDSL